MNTHAPRSISIPLDRLATAVFCTAAACYVFISFRRAQQTQRSVRRLEQEECFHISSAKKHAGDSEANATIAENTSNEVIPASSVGPSRPDAVVKGNAARSKMYEEMAVELGAKGLDSRAVKSAQALFGGLDSEWPGVWPMPYPLPFPSVRLVVLPLDGGQFSKDPALAMAAAALSAEVMKVLTMAGYRNYVNPRSSMHASMFYLSHPNDIRPDTSCIDGGDRFKNGAVAVPDAQALEAERETVHRIISTLPKVTLEVERALFTSGGTLLVLFKDIKSVFKESCTVDIMRKKFRNGFPGAPSKQPTTLIHSTLLRVLADQIPVSTLEKVTQVCSLWTSKNRGLRYTSDRAWLVHEKTFSNLEGDKFTFKFQE
mmetsp:Transcript_42260/g.80796  ORF Transcript_42260/g.80796 Transcript_42260/m.80796 type:complete len:372 (+) Transcript_42260:198-1313(+)